MPLTLRPSLRFLWPPLLAMLCVVAAVYLAARWWAVQDLKATTAVRVEQRAELLADQLESAVRQTELQLTQLSRRIGLRRLEDKEAMRSDLEWLLGRSGAFAWIGVARPDGVVAAGTRGWLEGLSIADRPVFRDAREKPFFGDFHPPLLLQRYAFGSSPGVPSVADLGIPVLDPDGQLAKVVVAHLDRGWFERLGNRLVSPQEAERLGFGWHLLDSQGNPVNGPMPFALAAPERARTETLASLAPGPDYLVAVRPVSMPGAAGQVRWTAVASLRLDAAQAPIRSLDRWLGTATLAAVLIAIALGAWVSRRLTGPYDRLIEEVTRRHADTRSRDVDLTRYLDSVTQKLSRQLAIRPGDAESALLLRIAQDAQQLRHLLDSLPMAVCIISSEHSLAYANARFNRELGHLFEDGSPLAMAQRLESAANPDATGWSAAPLELKAQDDSALFLSLRLLPLNDPDLPGAQVLIARNVTDQVLARRQALEVAERMQIFEDTVLDYGFIVLDAFTLVRGWSPGAAHITGLAAEHALGMPFAQLFGPGAVGDNAPDAVLRRAEDPGGAAFEAPLAQSGGRHIVARGTAYRLRQRLGTAHYAVVITDATAAAEAARRLQESEERLSAIIGGASDAIVSTDAQGRVTLFNPAAERIFGRPASQVLGGPLDPLIPAEARPTHMARIEGFGASGVTRRAMGSGVVAGVAADGTVLALQAAISKARVRDELVFTAILRDVTAQIAADERERTFAMERAALLQRLLEQEKETTRQLAQSLHDELGQTISALRFFFDANIGRQADTAPPPSAVQRLDGLIDDLNTQIRSALAGLRPPLLDELGLVAALDNEIAARRQDFSRLKVSLHGESGHRWPADLEYGAFMVAREALNNAWLHSGASAIDVMVEGDADSLRLVVVDNGTGVEGLMARSFAGHLGLVGMRERATAIGARLEIKSAPESGTEVSLEWRRNDEPPVPGR